MKSRTVWSKWKAHLLTTFWGSWDNHHHYKNQPSLYISGFPALIKWYFSSFSLGHVDMKWKGFNSTPFKFTTQVFSKPNLTQWHTYLLSQHSAVRGREISVSLRTTYFTSGAQGSQGYKESLQSELLVLLPPFSKWTLHSALEFMCQSLFAVPLIAFVGKGLAYLRICGIYQLMTKFNTTYRNYFAPPFFGHFRGLWVGVSYMSS